MKNLFTIVLLFVAALLYAQPKTEDLHTIDPRLTNGFTMLPMKLTGKEFKGSPKGAAGASNITMFIGLQKLQPVKVDVTRAKYQFKIIPYFSFNSWLADTVKKDPKMLTRVLDHEQGHYDIHVLMATELKRELSNTWFDTKDYVHGILEVRDKLSMTENKIRQLYHAETDEGRDAEAQKRWDEMIAKATQDKDWSGLVAYVKSKV